MTRLSDAEMAAILLAINTNARPVEPETRYIRQLFEHVWALEEELLERRQIIAERAKQIAALTEQRSTLRRANGELAGLLVEERDQVAVKAAAVAIDASEAES